MLNLAGKVSVEKARMVNDYTELRFENARLLQTPEAFALYENRFFNPEDIKKMCEEHYKVTLYEPVVSYIPKRIIDLFRNSRAVPITYIPSEEKVIAVYVPEIGHEKVELQLEKAEYLQTTIYFYLSNWQRLYGKSPLLKVVPVKTLFSLVITEALEVGAADITISSAGHSVKIYYNARKKKVNSGYVFSEEFMLDMIKLLTTKSPIVIGSREPKYVDYRVNNDYRARVLINHKYGGYMVTIRLLPDKAFNTDISKLGLTSVASEWLCKNYLDNVPGLRLIVGGTMNGKNTTALALLNRIAKSDKFKIVSVEMPVEQELPGVEQLNTETLEEYTENIKSSIHQNPDFLYITEIRDATALPTLQVTNTGKCVLSTLHSNSVADTISRLIDTTGLSQDRVIQALHSICYQELVRNEEKDIVFPRCRYVRFDSDLKYKLYGKSLGEALKIIREVEEGDEWTSTALTLQ